MVRLQYNKELVFPDLQAKDNDLWITIQNYSANPIGTTLFQLWKFYNLHINSNY